MIATSEAGTLSSTIITRLSVPTSSTSAMPTETWNSDKRSRRDSGRSGVAASANGRKRGPSCAQRATRPRVTPDLVWWPGEFKTSPVRNDGKLTRESQSKLQTEATPCDARANRPARR